MGWDKTRKGVDVRPRLVDKKSGVARLIDSGSMITATAKKPGDMPDNSRRLVAVNGSSIQTYGTREIEVKIGRSLSGIPLFEKLLFYTGDIRSDLPRPSARIESPLEPLCGVSHDLHLQLL